MKNAAVLMLVTLLCSANVLHAATIEQVEAELKAAQAKQAQRQAAAAAEQAQRNRAQAAAAADAARKATVLIRSDADCSLSVNAEASGELQAEQAKKLQVPAGDVLIECISSEDSAVKYSEVKTFTAQQNTVVLLELKAQLSALASERNEAAQAAQAAEAESERLAAIRNRFVDAGDGVLKDNQTGLYWTQSDNGSNVNWGQAGAWCQQRGQGWQLPSVDELAGIYDDSGNVSTQCGSLTCTVSSKFRLTSYWFWSATPGNGSGEAWGVGLVLGERFSLVVSFAFNRRALCVRRS